MTRGNTTSAQHLHQRDARPPSPSHTGAQCYVSIPEQEKEEESSSSSTFINLLVINEQLVREKRKSAIVFFLKKEKEIQLDYMDLSGMYNREETQCKSSA